MKNKIALLSLSILAVMTLLTAAAYAQDAEKPVQPAATPVSEQVNKTMAAEEQSIYGEVQSVDATGTGSLTVQYYDYDADDEKTVNISIDANTKLENAGSAADIKKGDWADVTYSTDGGKNKAASIIVEKEEEAVPPVSPAPEQVVKQEQAKVSDSESN